MPTPVINQALTTQFKTDVDSLLDELHKVQVSATDNSLSVNSAVSDATDADNNVHSFRCTTKDEARIKALLQALVDTAPV